MSVQKTLLPLVRKYFENDPLAAAHSLEAMPEEEAIGILRTLPTSLSAQAFPYLQVGYAAGLLKDLPTDICNSIIEKLDPQQGAMIFINLPDTTRKKFLELLPEKIKRQIQELLTYPEHSAGRMMLTDFLAFHIDVKVKDAVHKIRTVARRKSPPSYTYVVDHENRLVGVLNMRDLLLAPNEETLETVMRKEIFTVNAFMDNEQVAEELSKRRYFAAPVVDAESRLLGIVKAEQLIDQGQKEATEDFQKMFGAGGDERVSSPVNFSIRMRLPWLFINLATAFLAGWVVSLFQGIIAKVTVLAVYLPIIAGQGGNGGAQSLAVVMRGIVMREIPANKAWQLTLKEFTIGIINGIAIGIVTAVIAVLWHKNPVLGLVVGFAMIINLAVAGLTGAAIPLIMKSLGLDPAQCSNIILTTFTDVMGFFGLLGLATVFQKYLI